MKTLTRIVLALLVVSAGAVWAANTTVDEPPAPASVVPDVSPPDVSPPAEPSEEASLEELLNGDLLLEAGACCFADCLEERIQCRSTCDVYDTACLAACNKQFESCSNNC